MTPLLSEELLKRSAAVMRARNRKPIKDIGGMVSVLIPYCEWDKKFLKRTIDSVKDTAGGEIEILSLLDKHEEGHRVLTNRMANRAKGKYLFRLDAHCAMSSEWDLRMKESCKENTIVVSILDCLRVDDWSFAGKEMGMVVLTPTMRNSYSREWKSFDDRDVEEEMMSIIGCAYMIQKDTFLGGGGCDESLSRWGAAGLELSLKTWLTGGRVVARTDVECAHLFRPEGKTPFVLNKDKIDESYLKIGRMWASGNGPDQTRPLSWLVEKFAAYIELNYKENVKKI